MTEPVLRHPKLQRLYDYWSGRRADSTVPLVDRLEPSDMREWIGNLLVMDVVEGDNFVYSYYGRSFEQAFGIDMVGKSIELLPAGQRDLLQAEYDRVRQAAEPTARTYTADFGGRQATWERLVLPLSTDGAAVDKLLVAAYELEPTH